MRVTSIAVALCLTGCTTDPDFDRVRAERFIGHPLPAAAGGVRIEAEQGIDTLVLIRFDTTARLAESFAARLLGKPPGSGGIPAAGRHGEGRDWWLPPDAAGVRHGTGESASGVHYRLAMLPRANGRATVWLAAFDT